MAVKWSQMPVSRTVLLEVCNLMKMWLAVVPSSIYDTMILKHCVSYQTAHTDHPSWRSVWELQHTQNFIAKLKEKLNSLPLHHWQLTSLTMKAGRSVPTQLHHSVLWLYRLCLISGRSLTITVAELLQVKSLQGRTDCETLTFLY